MSSTLAASPHPKPVVRLQNISKAFPGVQALSHVSLDLHGGEVHVLLGENGAGKSTLMKVLCGQYAPDEGRVELDGEALTLRTPHEAQSRGLVMIYQELNTIDGLTVAENIFLGQEPMRGALVDAARLRQDAQRLLSRLRCDIDPDTRVADLSVAQKQLVEIAKALRYDARVLVMDEPTAALSAQEIEALFAVIRDLCADGVAIVYISHRMEEILEIGDRITVMRDGTYVGTYACAETSVDALIPKMVGRSIDDAFPKRQVSFGKTLLDVQGVAREGVLQPTSFTVRAGEIFGIAGLMGSGRTELARAIFGADACDAGSVSVAGQILQPHDPGTAIEAGLGFITEDRKDQGLVLMRSVQENVGLASLNRVLGGFGWLRLGADAERAERFVDRLRVRTPDLDAAVGNLSGGNQQKVVLAKWLAAQCRVLIFDEPTRGIDLGAKAEIYELLGELVQAGVAIVLISSEMPELLGLADRIGVMHEGRMRVVLPRGEATQATIMHHALGG